MPGNVNFYFCAKLQSQTVWTKAWILAWSLKPGKQRSGSRLLSAGRDHHAAEAKRQQQAEGNRR